MSDRAFYILSARISLNQARQRRINPRHVRQPGFIAWLLDSAAKDRLRAAAAPRSVAARPIPAILPAVPAQLELFA